MDFIDEDGNIIVPKSVRPVIDLSETVFGSKKGAKKQYRYGNLHIREYDNDYTVHMDSVNPLQNPLGHLLIDAPEYLASAVAAMIVGKQIGATVYTKRKQECKSCIVASLEASISGYIAGSSASRITFEVVNYLKNRGK